MRSARRTRVHYELRAARSIEHGQLRESDVIADAHPQPPHLQEEGKNKEGWPGWAQAAVGA